MVGRMMLMLSIESYSCHLHMDWGIVNSVTLLAKKELVLHQGQANDALHQPHIELGHCSYLYHTQVRHASHSQQKVTGASDNVHSRIPQMTLSSYIAWISKISLDFLGLSPRDTKGDGKGTHGIALLTS